MASFCRHCGNAIADGEVRCVCCGALLASSSPFIPHSSSRLNGNLAEGRFAPPSSTSPQETPDELLEQAFRLMDEGAFDDAILLCRRALTLDPQKVAAYGLLGNLYERVGEPERALKAYEQALALDSHYEPAKLGIERLQQAREKPPPFPESLPPRHAQRHPLARSPAAFAGGDSISRDDAFRRPCLCPASFVPRLFWCDQLSHPADAFSDDSLANAHRFPVGAGSDEKRAGSPQPSPL